jgi:hypothetical protein
VIERADASPRTTEGVLSTMVKHGWLSAGRDNGTYYGTTALHGEPGGDVLSVLPKDRKAPAPLETVAERLGADRLTAFAAVNEARQAWHSTYDPVGWYHNEY